MLKNKQFYWLIFVAIILVGIFFLKKEAVIEPSFFNNDTDYQKYCEKIGGNVKDAACFIKTEFGNTYDLPECKSNYLYTHTGCYTLVSQAKSLCEKKGKTWFTAWIGQNQIPYCLTASSDAGKNCNDSDECQGFCEIPNDRNKSFKERCGATTGNCGEFNIPKDYHTCTVGDNLGKKEREGSDYNLILD